MSYFIEIATTDYNSTRQAVEAGADRIELCAALSEGGTTPSYGTLIRCRNEFSLPIFPMIRPRSGDFLYNEAEYDIMKMEIKLCRQLGYEGVVFGLLTRDGDIDKKRTAALIELAYPMEVTFHRAFDRCRDPHAALELLIESGCSRILTSGQKPSAPEGKDLIRELVQAAGDRLIILPGAGVRPDNIRQLAQDTGAVEFHSSLRSKMKTGMTFIHPSFNEQDYDIPSVDANEVKAIRHLE